MHTVGILDVAGAIALLAESQATDIALERLYFQVVADVLVDV